MSSEYVRASLHDHEYELQSNHIPPETAFALATQLEETRDKQHENDKPNVMPTQKLPNATIFRRPAFRFALGPLRFALVPWEFALGLFGFAWGP